MPGELVTRDNFDPAGFEFDDDANLIRNVGGNALNSHYVNVVNKLADGTYDATLAGALVTNGATGLDAGRLTMIHDGTDAGILESMGPAAPPVLYVRQPQLLEVYHAHIFVTGSGAAADEQEYAQKLIEFRPDQPLGAPHMVTIQGETRRLTGDPATFNAKQNGHYFIGLTAGDLTLALPSADLIDQLSSFIKVTVIDLNSNTFTINGTVVVNEVDIVNPTPGVGTYVFESDGLFWHPGAGSDTL